MDLRTVLLAGTLALAATAIHAEEFQLTIQGAACSQGTFNCGTSLPVTITADLNTLNATLTPTFGFNSFVGAPIVTNLAVSFPVTNYTEIVGGQTLAFHGHSSAGFGCLGPVVGNFLECGGSLTAVSFGDTEIWMQTETESQYQAFKDPLASILLRDPNFRCTVGGVSSQCQIDAGPFGFVGIEAQVTFTPVSVPAPGPLSLFLAGGIGLALSRRKQQEGSATEGTQGRPSARRSWFRY